MSNRDYVRTFLSHSGYLVINRALIRTIGLNETVLLSLMMDRDSYFIEKKKDIDGWFYSVKEYIQDNLNLGRKPIDSAMNNLVNSNLIETKLLGIPAKKYYRVNYDGIKDLMDRLEPSSESDTDDPDCPKRTNKDDQDGQVSNNKEEQITNNKEQTVKEKRKKESFDLSFVNINFQETFNMWLDYKRSKNQMYKRQVDVEIAYRKLLEYSNNDPKTAQEIIESAILGNYMGFFAPKTQQSYGNSSNETTSLAKQFAANLKATGKLFG